MKCLHSKSLAKAHFKCLLHICRKKYREVGRLRERMKEWRRGGMRKETLKWRKLRDLRTLYTMYSVNNWNFVPLTHISMFSSFWSRGILSYSLFLWLDCFIFQTKVRLQSLYFCTWLFWLIILSAHSSMLLQISRFSFF